MATTKYGSTWTGTYSGGANRYFRAYCTYTTSETATTFTLSVSAIGIQKTEGGECVMVVNTKKTAKLTASGASVKSGNPISKSTTAKISWDSGSQYKSLGSGTIVFNKTESAQTATLTLYADKSGGDTSTAWGGTSTGTFTITIPAAIIVSYSANGGSDAPLSQIKTYNEDLIISESIPTRTGYNFIGWSTSPTGSVEYSSGGTYTANSSVTLYAVWEAIAYTVSYDANGGSGAPSSQTKLHGSILKLSSIIPTRDTVNNDDGIVEYTFKGWAMSPTSTYVDYVSGGDYALDSSITLYAVWATSVSVDTYDVYYNTLSSSKIIPQIKIKDEPLTLRDTIPVKLGYTFNGWSLSADNTGSVDADYNAGDTYTGNDDLMLYAIWTPWSHTVEFNSNCASGSEPSYFVKTTGIDVTIPESDITKENYVFRYWSTSPTGNGGLKYNAGDGYDNIQNGGVVTLYAIWAEKKISVYQQTNNIEATFFIEGSESTYLKNDGTVYAMEFIEDGNLSLEKLSFHLNEMIER